MLLLLILLQARTSIHTSSELSWFSPPPSRCRGQHGLRGCQSENQSHPEQPRPRRCHLRITISKTNPYNATVQPQLAGFKLRTALAWASLSMTPLLDRSASRNTARLRSTCTCLVALESDLLHLRWKTDHKAMTSRTVARNARNQTISQLGFRSLVFTASHTGR